MLNSASVPGSGTLDLQGAATTTFELPPGAPASLVGWTLNHAFVVHEGTMPTFASNAVPLTFVASP